MKRFAGKQVHILNFFEETSLVTNEAYFLQVWLLMRHTFYGRHFMYCALVIAKQSPSQFQLDWTSMVFLSQFSTPTPHKKKFDTNFFSTQKFCDQKLFNPKNYLTQENFFNEICFLTHKIFFDSKLFLNPKHFFEPKKFSTQKIFGPKNFF